VLLRNLTPSSTAEASFESTTPGAVVVVQMEHGHAELTAEVVNDQLTAVMTFPLASAAPLTVAVYTVEVASPLVGVNVAVRLVPSYVVVPPTAVPLEFFKVMEIVEDCTASLKVAVTVVLVGTLVPPLAGLRLVTVGAVVSVAVVLKTTSTQ